jgi:hypothetical protein
MAQKAKFKIILALTVTIHFLNSLLASANSVKMKNGSRNSNLKKIKSFSI